MPGAHLFALIPLLSALACAGVAAAIVARDPEARPNRLAAAFLGCAAAWSVADLLFMRAGSAAVAERMDFAASVLSFALAPLGVQVLLSLEPSVERRLRGWAAACWGLAVAVALVRLAAGDLVTGVVPAPWGWRSVAGPWMAPVSVILTAPPLVAVTLFLRHRERADTDPDRYRGIVLAVSISLVGSFGMEVALPVAGVATPGASGAPFAIWGAITFWTIYRFRAPRLEPRTFAREILSTLPSGVLLVRGDGSVRASNPTLGELVGVPHGELVGARCCDLLRGPPATRSLAAAGDREYELVRADGRTLPVSVSETPLVGADGEPVGSILVVRDLREMVELRRRLLTSGRLAAMGQLASGIAHEINNPVAYVRANLASLRGSWKTLADAAERRGLAEQSAAEVEAVPELLSECEDGVDRIVSIVRDVGGFSLGGGHAREHTDVRTLLDAAVRVASPQLRDGVEVVRSYADVPLVSCVPQELMQVFLNLLLNARQAMADGGEIHLAVERAGDGVRVAVHDTGPGIPPEQQSLIFEPFFTTKPAGQGTGLGLAISRQIVRRHGGSIEVASEAGAGATFTVRLPAADAPAVSAALGEGI